MLLGQFILPICGAEIELLIAETASFEERHKVLHEQLLARPLWADALVKKVNSSRGDNEPLTLEHCIRHAGIENVKCMLILQKISEVIPSKLLEVEPNSGLVIASSQQLLSFALKNQEYFGSDGPQKDIIFASGLVFDLLRIWMNNQPDAGIKKKVLDFLTVCYAEAVTTTRVAIELGKASKRLALEKQIMPLIFLYHASFAVMAHIFPSYLDFIKNSKKLSIPIAIQNLREAQVYGGHHHLFAAILSWPFPIFENLTDTLVHLDSPHYIPVSPNSDSYDVAAIVFLANYLKLNQSTFQKPKKFEAKTLRPELHQLDLFVDTALIFKKGG